MSRHAKFTINKEKFLLSHVRSEYKNVVKFARDTDFHLFGYKLEDSFEKAKGSHHSLLALKPKTSYPHASAKQEFHEISKIDSPTKRPMDSYKSTPQHNSPSTWAELKK